MKYEELERIFKTRPFFETYELVTLFNEPEPQIMSRISRWVKQGKLIRLRRGKYLLASPYQKKGADLFYISNYLYTPSFISLFTALQHYHCIPEEVHVIQAITTRQTAAWDTSIGRFRYFSTVPDRFFGYSKMSLGDSEQQNAYIADVERALVDICYFSTGEWEQKRWSELRLQNVERFSADRLQEYAGRLKSQKVQRGIRQLLDYLNGQACLPWHRQGTE